MNQRREHEIYAHAAQSFDKLRAALEAITEFMKPETPPHLPVYYKGRNLMKEGKASLDDAIKDAKKLLGPAPAYSSQEFQKFRDATLAENKIVLQGRNPEDLTAELSGDAFVKNFVTDQEISEYVLKSYSAQQSGKRKIENMKIRLILDTLLALHGRVQELQKKAQRKQQGLPEA
jgi:hypothetical protein